MTTNTSQESLPIKAAMFWSFYTGGEYSSNRPTIPTVFKETYSQWSLIKVLELCASSAACRGCGRVIYVSSYLQWGLDCEWRTKAVLTTFFCRWWSQEPLWEMILPEELDGCLRQGLWGRVIVPTGTRFFCSIDATLLAFLSTSGKIKHFFLILFISLSLSLSPTYRLGSTCSAV